ncbi:hypothetical protein RchiOBHm_Chr7g0177051 [Rosa chinensis]|uniref:Uncharacterized protein n=1 Tax=Rosa chinensis TaxID=74649 RepID=A0A2P6P1G6_ROSCH|nr:hypothetical protein RchiOBHm_Chr7g0177051 [Rosa chinensis]
MLDCFDKIDRHWVPVQIPRHGGRRCKIWVLSFHRFLVRRRLWIVLRLLVDRWWLTTSRIGWAGVRVCKWQQVSGFEDGGRSPGLAVVRTWLC